MEDVDDVRELVEERMRDTGFEDDILERVMDLLDTFDTDREALFEEMLAKLEQPGYDGLTDRWETNCEQAAALLDRLEEDMASILEDSEANAMSPEERMAAVGPSDFLEGERRVWAQVATLEVPEAAALMSKILETNIAVIKKCEEDLKNARSNDAIVEEVLRRNFTKMSELANALVTKYVQLPSGIARLVVLFMKDPAAKAALTELIQAWEKAAAENYEAAKQKRAAKQMVLDNIKLLTDAREQLDEEWIDRVFVRGAEAAGAWRGTGQNGDYQAADWDWMKDNVQDRGLDERAEAAKEQARMLYDELHPTFVTESTKAFAQLTDDPATLQKFTEELETAVESLEELLATESDFVSDLADGDYKQTAYASVEQAKADLRAGWDMLTSKTKEADDEVKE